MGAMIVHRLAVVCLCFWFSAAAWGHGGVVEEDDLCIIKVNYLRAHFKIYQPRVTGHEQFCEDLPVASESVFVMEYEHDALSYMPIEFRIIRDVTGKGRFARMEDVEQIPDIDAVTVLYREPEVEPSVYTVLHEFSEEGDFIGIVSARHPETGVEYASVFPFEVGFTGLGYWPFIIGLLVLIQVQYLVMSGRFRRWFGRSSAAALLLVFALPVAASDPVVTWMSPDGDIEINKMHSWILHIETEDGTAIEGATLEVSGGMPEHDHGLPTRPRVTEDLGDGKYRVDGLRFHMRGYWEIEITIRSDDETSIVIIPLQL